MQILEENFWAIIEEFCTLDVKKGDEFGPFIMNKCEINGLQWSENMLLLLHQMKQRDENDHANNSLYWSTQFSIEGWLVKSKHYERIWEIENSRVYARKIS